MDENGEQVPPPGFNVALSLRLPRDRLSVPFVRHLVHHAQGEVGVLAEDAACVELALVEVGHGFDFGSLDRGPSPSDAESGRGVTIMRAARCLILTGLAQEDRPV